MTARADPQVVVPLSFGWLFLNHPRQVLHTLYIIQSKNHPFEPQPRQTPQAVLLPLVQKSRRTSSMPPIPESADQSSLIVHNAAIWYLIFDDGFSTYPHPHIQTWSIGISTHQGVWVVLAGISVANETPRQICVFCLLCLLWSFLTSFVSLESFAFFDSSGFFPCSTCVFASSASFAGLAYFDYFACFASFASFACFFWGTFCFFCLVCGLFCRFCFFRSFCLFCLIGLLCVFCLFCCFAALASFVSFASFESLAVFACFAFFACFTQSVLWLWLFCLFCIFCLFSGLVSEYRLPILLELQMQHAAKRLFAMRPNCQFGSRGCSRILAPHQLPSVSRMIVSSFPRSWNVVDKSSRCWAQSSRIGPIEVVTCSNYGSRLFEGRMVLAAFLHDSWEAVLNARLWDDAGFCTSKCASLDLKMQPGDFLPLLVPHHAACITRSLAL